MLSDGRQQPDSPPAWALEQARSDLFDVHDRGVIVSRAWELVHQAELLDQERHDEYDDPDQGGEA